MQGYPLAFVHETRSLAVDNHGCPQCLAPAGHPCLSKRPGRTRRAVHGPRFDLATVSRRLRQRLYSAET